MPNRLHAPDGPFETKNKLPEYDYLSDMDPEAPGARFKEWIASNNKRIFDRFASRTLKILQQLSARDAGKIAGGDMAVSLEPAKRMLETPFPVDSMRALGRKLLLPAEQGGLGLVEPGSTSTLANFNMKGTMEYHPHLEKKVVRKLYVMPPVAALEEFVPKFYAALDQLKTPIYASKIHTDDMTIDAEAQAFTAQAHNTFVIYIADDRTIPHVLRAIRLAEKEILTKEPAGLPSYDAAEVTKSALLLNGKVILGGPDMPRKSELEGDKSFDTWSNGVANAARQAFLANPQMTEDECRQVMATELYNRTGKAPNEYLSPL